MSFDELIEGVADEIADNFGTEAAGFIGGLLFLFGAAILDSATKDKETK